MKKVGFMFALVLAFTLNAFAQSEGQSAQPMPLGTEKTEKQKGKGHHGGPGAGQAMNMKKELGITDEQGAKLKGINETMKGKMQAVRSDNSLTKEQKQVQVKQINEAHDAEVKTVLTAEQYTKWTAAKQGRKDKMKEKRSEKN